MDRALSDGVVTIRAPVDGDAATLIAGRDDEFRRYIGPGAEHPQPAGCIVVGGAVVGWVDYDHDDDHAWLAPGEVNVGYSVFPEHRGKGYASRAVQLLLHHLAADTDERTASLLINPDNVRSLAVAERLGFVPAGDIDGSRYFTWTLRP